MIYEQHITVIVMLTGASLLDMHASFELIVSGLVEAGKQKCSKYWPDLYQSEVYDDFEVSSFVALSSLNRADHAERGRERSQSRCCDP